ncbi:MAG: hypothetical protein JNM17_26180 [Archangium sp.]|nr:hypothetical protein [Archangium sp.]
MLWLKWKLMVTTLPFVAVITGIRILLHYKVGFEGVVEFSDVGVVLTGAVFLTGFLLAGTMADYKESEKLPGELANSLDTMDEYLQLCARVKPQSVNGKEMRAHVLALTDRIRDWLLKKATVNEVYALLTKMNAVIAQLDAAGASSYGSRVAPEVVNVRKSVIRIDVISRTGFLPPAYALLEVLLTMILALLMASKFKSQIAEFILVPFVSLVNLYMLRLIRDIDDPFDYASDGAKRGGAEVDLFPIDEFRQRLNARE